MVLFSMKYQKIKSVQGIDNIKTNSAHGINGIPSKFVKMAKCVHVSFTKLFNICIKEEIFSEEFKIAYVIPITKVSTPKTFGDLRPISILSMFSKIFEKSLENKISKFINKNHIITPSLFGFWKNNSTELAIGLFYDKLLSNLNNNSITCSIFLT